MVEFWNSTHKRFIAVVNIVGFNEFIQKKDHHSVKERIEVFHQITLNSIEHIIKQSDGEQKIEEMIKFVFDSESILLISKDDSETSLQNLLVACQILTASFVFEQIPVRGIVSYGTITADFEHSIFFGRSLTSAKAFLDHFEMYGIFLDSKVEKISGQHSSKAIDKYCFFQKVPTTSGLVKYYSVNWVEIAAQISRLSPAQLLGYYYSEISGLKRKYLDNTLEFYESLPDETKNEIESKVSSYAR